MKLRLPDFRTAAAASMARGVQEGPAKQLTGSDPPIGTGVALPSAIIGDRRSEAGATTAKIGGAAGNGCGAPIAPACARRLPDGWAF